MAGRRSNGEGSPRRMRSRNLYQYRWTEWVDGGSVRRSGYAKTRTAAVVGLRVTEDTYSHVTPRLSAQATAVLNQAI